MELLLIQLIYFIISWAFRLISFVWKSILFSYKNAFCVNIVYLSDMLVFI